MYRFVSANIGARGEPIGHIYMSVLVNSKADLDFGIDALMRRDTQITSAARLRLKRARTEPFDNQRDRRNGALLRNSERS